MLHGYAVTDAHAHVFPDKIAERATAGISHFYNLPMAYHGHVSEMLQNGQSAGVDRFLVCSPATIPEQVGAINTFLAACGAAYDICIPFGTLHPKSRYLREDFEQLLQLRLHGIKLHPDFQNFPIDDPAAYPMYDMISCAGLPVLMHMGDAHSDFSHPARLQRLLEQFPRLRVIAAHLGGWGHWSEAQTLLKPDKRLRFDTCSSMAFMPLAQARDLIRHFGAENCFFGTDYPMWDYKEELERFFALSLSERENRNILSENFDLWMAEKPKG